MNKEYTFLELSSYGTSELISLVISLQGKYNRDAYKPICELCEGKSTCKYNTFCTDIAQ